MDIIQVIGVFVLCISQISSKPEICGPNTSEIIFGKHGIICATTSEVPEMRHLSLDSKLVPVLMARPLTQQNSYFSNNYRSGQIDRRPDLIEDKIVKYQRMLLEKLNRDSLAKRLVRNQLSPGIKPKIPQHLLTLYKNSNIQNPVLSPAIQNPILSPVMQNPIIQSQIALQNAQQTYADNLNMNLYENSGKQVINIQQNLKKPTNDDLKQIQDYVQHLRNQMRQKSVETSENISDQKSNEMKSLENVEPVEHSLNNRQNRLISGMSETAETDSNKIQKETQIDAYNDEESGDDEPQVSQTQVHYQYVVQDNPSHNFRQQNSFGFPQKAVRNHNELNVVFGSPKIPKLNFGFKPLFNHFQHKERQNTEEVEHNKYIQVLNPINREHKRKTLTRPSSKSLVSDKNYEELITAESQNYEKIHDSQSRKWQQNSNYYLNSEPNKYYNEFNLDKTRIEYDGWKPIRMNRISKTVSDQQLFEEENFATTSSIITTSPQLQIQNSTNFDVMSFGKRVY